MMNDFGDNLKKLRNEAGLTQKKLADELEISPSAVGMYEHGRRKPDYEMLIKVSRLFSVSIDCLVGNTEVPNEATDIIKEMKSKILSSNNITLNGVLMTKSEREQLLSAIEIATNVILSNNIQK